MTLRVPNAPYLSSFFLFLLLLIFFLRYILEIFRAHVKDLNKKFYQIWWAWNAPRSCHTHLNHSTKTFAPPCILRNCGKIDKCVNEINMYDKCRN